jgi:hypothetical protein
MDLKGQLKLNNRVLNWRIDEQGNITIPCDSAPAALATISAIGSIATQASREPETLALPLGTSSQTTTIDAPPARRRGRPPKTSQEG